MRVSIPQSLQKPQFKRLYTDFHDCAYTRCINMTLLACERGKTRSDVHVTHTNALNGSSDQLHPYAAIGLIDHSAASAIYTMVDEQLGCSTLDLRIDFTTNTTTDRYLCDTKVIHLNDFNASIFSEVRNTLDQVVATGTGLFQIGAFPGKSLGNTNIDYQVPTPQRCHSLIDALGFEDSSEGVYSPAENKAVIGWPPANVYHGAATTSLLAYASQRVADATNLNQRLSAIHTNFIRPGIGGTSLLTHTDLIRPGKSASLVTATAYHQSNKPVATSQCIFTQ